MDEVSQLLDVIDRSYDQASWHGVNLRGSIRRVSLTDAVRRPKRGAHNIWEITVHAAYWKYAVRRFMTGEPRGSFPLKGSDWFRRPVSRTEAAWREDKRLLGEQHRALRATIADLRPADLARPSARRRYTLFDLVSGVAAHDLYHAGQIQLIKRLIK
jgi:uncharacterized damage-inducible protein DinB